MKTTSAPGSLFLTGEYAVLVGGVAVISCVDRYATATRGADEFTVEGHTFDDALPQAVCEALKVPMSKTEDVLMNLDGFYQDDVKMGLSSSAASTVALAKLLKSKVSEKAVVEAHTLFQNGRGSGADVRAAYRGGTWALRTVDPEPPFTGRKKIAPEPEATPIDWPDWLEVRAVWLGKPAQTTDMIEALEQNLDRAKVQKILVEIHEFSLRFAEALSGRSVGACLTAFSYAAKLMDQLGTECGIPIVIQRHRELASSLPSPFVAKPSGAGGGDFSLVAGPRDADWDSLPVRFEDLIFDVESDGGF